MFELVLATTNQGKLAELASAFAGLPVYVRALNAFPTIPEIEETGLTFAENAALKASGYARHLGVPTLADDSGLEVDALDGRPGVLSARYGGGVSYDDKMRKLLAEIPAESTRTARFSCAIAMASAEGNIVANVQGICEGTVADAPRGTKGFGYDPIFIPTGFDKTFGELPDETKRSISHRARALLAIEPYLREFIAFST